MATQKKKTKAARSKELSKIKRLLKKDEYRQQAIELLVTLDDPEHWKAINAMVELTVDKFGFAQVGNTNMRLLSLLPDELEGVAEKKRVAQQMRLQSGSVLIASAVPYVQKIVVQGKRGTPWPSLDELAKLEHLRDLELWYLPLGQGDSLTALECVTRLVVAQSDIQRIPELPNLEELRLENLGSVSVGPLPKLRSFHISRAPALIDWSGIGVSSVLERVEVVGDSLIAHLDPIGEAVERGAPLREVQLQKCAELESIRGLEGARHLERLHVRSAPKLEDISALASMGSLRTLELRDCGVRDVSMLRNLECLEVLDLTGCSEAVGIEALKDHPRLRVVALGGTSFTRDEVGALLRWSTWAPTPHIQSLEARER